MQFDDDLDTVYHDLIRSPLEDRGHTVNRADDISKDQSILRTIVHGIKDADLIIADLTGRNPNVYYELGVAHDMRKPTLHIVQDYDDLAFDVRPFNAIRYSTRYNEANKLTDEILEIIERTPANKYRFSNPVHEGLDDDSNIYIGSQATDSDEVVIVSAGEEIRNAEITVNIIFDIVSAIAEHCSNAAETNHNYKERVATLNENHESSERLLATRVFTAYAYNFANKVSANVPLLIDTWKALDQDLERVYIANSVTTGKEKRDVSIFVENLMLLTEKVSGIADNLDTLRDSFIDDESLASDVNRELRLSKTTIRRLTDELRVGAAVLSNIAQRINSALHQTIVENQL